MTNGEAITELHMLQCRFHQIRKSDAAWEAIEMAKDALLAREKSKDDLFGKLWRGHTMIISTQIVTVWVLTLFMAYLAGSRPNKR